MINQYPTKVKKDMKIWYVLAIVIVAIVLVGVFVFYPKPEKPPETPKIFCGDGTCSKTENCYDCPKDCKCKADEYCAKETKKCAKPVCGNGKCEPFENSENCCDDCKCLSQQICNKTSHKCEYSVTVSDERVKQLVTEYFERQGKKVFSIDSIIPSEYEGKPVKNCGLRLEEDKDERVHLVAVTNQEEVIEIPVWG